MFFLELLWFFVKGLGGYGEEFCGVCGAVGVDNGGFVLVGAFDELLKFWLHDGGPFFVATAGF